MKKHLMSAVVLLLISGSLSAATIKMGYSTTNGEAIAYTINGAAKSTLALEFSPVELDFDDDGSYDLTTISYCVDLLQTTGNGSVYAVELQSAVAKGDNYRNAAWLMNEFSAVADTAAKKAGLQVAIWEAIYDSSHSLDSGGFSVQSTSGGAYANANIYLSALAGVSSFSGLENYMVAYSATRQDQLIATPLPAAAWLFGSGLLGVLGFGRKQLG